MRDSSGRQFVCRLPDNVTGTTDSDGLVSCKKVLSIILYRGWLRPKQGRLQAQHVAKAASP